MDKIRLIFIVSCFGILCCKADTCGEENAQKGDCKLVFGRILKHGKCECRPTIPLENIVRVEIGHSMENKTCTDFETCSSLVKQMHEIDMKEYFRQNTRFNYFLGFDGRLYSGNGMFAFADEKNKTSGDTLKICVVGGATWSTPLNIKMIETLFTFLNCNRDLLAKNYYIMVGLKNEFEALKKKGERCDNFMKRVKLGEMFAEKHPPNPSTLRGRLVFGLDHIRRNREGTGEKISFKKESIAKAIEAH